jgi:hypothetical protein
MVKTAAVVLGGAVAGVILTVLLKKFAPAAIRAHL